MAVAILVCGFVLNLTAGVKNCSYGGGHGIQARVDANIQRYRARFCKRSNLLIPN